MVRERRGAGHAEHRLRDSERPSSGLPGRPVVDDYKHLVQFLHFQLLGRLRDLALLLDDAPQRRLVPLVPIRLLPLCVHPQVPLNVLLDGDPAVVYTRAEDVNSLKDAAILLQNQADQSHGFARF